jgi:hypothetical protein
MVGLDEDGRDDPVKIQLEEVGAVEGKGLDGLVREVEQLVIGRS